MSIGTLKGSTVEVRLWTQMENLESKAMQQLKNIASLPWVFHHVAAMPDVHYGIGATVGSVIAMKDAVTPAAVGVDIGCGMGAVKTNLKASQLPDSLKDLRAAVEKAIPVGYNEHAQHERRATKRGEELYYETEKLFKEFKNLLPEVQDIEGKALKQLGTLGGGNHFVELCLDTEDNVWLMLHSGSRRIGKDLAEIHIGRAKRLAHNQDIPDRDLSVFLAGTPEMDAYKRDLFWAQRYAMLNRKVMMDLYKSVLEKFVPFEVQQEVWCHHNYVAEEVHYGENVLVTRKGAIRAGKGELGIIPGSMGTKSFIVSGKGNPESFESASHGAGRKMSRGEAKRRFSLEDLEKQTAGVECRKDSGVLDEIPEAYKNIEQVMANQTDLVEVKAELRQIMCVKG